MKPCGSMLSMRGKAVWGQKDEQAGGQAKPTFGLRSPPKGCTHHARFGGEDDNLVERRELLQKAVDAWALLEAPASDELQERREAEEHQTGLSAEGRRGGEAQELTANTHRPFGVQQDVGELDDEGVRRLVVGLAQRVWQQLGTGGLDDHLD